MGLNGVQSLPFYFSGFIAPVTVITLKQHLNTLVGDCLAEVSGIGNGNANVITASKPEFGDYQANGVMAVARQLQCNPRELATRVVAALREADDPLVSSFDIAGPGFINIHLRDSALLDRAREILGEPGLLIPVAADPQTVVVDYSSPNLAKEMHVGHLRGTIIGDCLARVLERLGHRIIRQNHVGDWGTQFGMLIACMQEITSEQGDLPQQLADLEEFYRMAKARFDADADFADRARNNVVRLQSGEPDLLQVWRQFIEESLGHCEEIYDKLNVTLGREDLDAESRYNDELPDIVQVLAQQSLLATSEGAMCVFLPEFAGKDGKPLPVIIRKSDGGYLYSTTDLAAIRLRSFGMAATRSLYVVDARQALHFQQVFAVARASGLASEAISLEHIAYGTMMGRDGKPIKTRSGDLVKLRELLAESVQRAFELVSEKNPKLDAALRRTIAEKVGIAAVKYADLSKNRTSDYIFDWSTMLSFEGNTAPYLLYAYARIRSILGKEEVSAGHYMIAQARAREERLLLVKILQLPEVVQAVAQDCYPNQLCNYLYELAGLFMRFYEACPILKAEPAVRDSRLGLCRLTAGALHQGLDLLGIETLERM